jgi:hypothetical protein
MLDMTKRDSILDCEPGVIRLFGAADIGTKGLLSGWSGPEEGHTWNAGVEAAYALAVKPPVTRLLLTLMGEPYITRARPVQEMTLFGNGYRLGFWRMSARVETVLQVVLEPEWWLERGSRATMRLLLHMPHCVRPKDINDGQDGRELAFCARSLSLRPIAG